MDDHLKCRRMNRYNLVIAICFHIYLFCNATMLLLAGSASQELQVFGFTFPCAWFTFYMVFFIPRISKTTDKLASFRKNRSILDSDIHAGLYHKVIVFTIVGCLFLACCFLLMTMAGFLMNHIRNQETAFPYWQLLMSLSCVSLSFTSLLFFSAYKASTKPHGDKRLKQA